MEDVVWNEFLLKLESNLKRGLLFLLAAGMTSILVSVDVTSFFSAFHQESLLQGDPNQNYLFKKTTAMKVCTCVCPRVTNLKNHFLKTQNIPLLKYRDVDKNLEKGNYDMVHPVLHNCFSFNGLKSNQRRFFSLSWKRKLHRLHQ